VPKKFGRTAPGFLKEVSAQAVVIDGIFGVIRIGHLVQINARTNIGLLD